MPSPGKTRLDALEARLTGPKRIALFGHRNVGKTTLLAMFYRQAASGQVPGVRLAAADAQCAEYLAEKIAQVESGQPMSGTLAETEAQSAAIPRARGFEMIVRDYQGEHVALGSTEPIQEFFAGCDAVFFCLDPEGSSDPAERRRRQQEVEGLLERYIERSEDLSTDRPVALLLTKFDRVLAGLGKRSGDANDDSTEADQGSESRAPAQPCGSVRRAAGRPEIRHDLARLAAACARWCDLRRQLIRARIDGQPTAGDPAPDGTRGPPGLAGRAARGTRPHADGMALGAGTHRLSPAPTVRDRL